MTAELRAYARDAARRAGIDPAGFERQIDQESGFNPRAHNAGSDASGIAQIIPRWHPGVDVWDPEASLDYAAGLIAAYRKQFGSYREAYAAYNWGSGNVGGYTKADGTVVPPWDGRRETLPAETRHYLDVILGPGWPEPGAAPMGVTYNRAAPAIPQDDNWSCAPTSLRWALTALGRNPGPTYIENLLVRDGVVSHKDGVMDATGAGLAAWIGKTGEEYYGSDGYYGNHEPSVSWAWACAEGAANPDGSAHGYPVMLGGRRWNHWSGLRDYDPARKVLLLANPALGWQGVGQEMTRAQFDALGPFSAVRVLHPDLLGTAPKPIPPSPPADTRLARARAKLVEAIAILDEVAP